MEEDDLSNKITGEEDAVSLLVETDPDSIENTESSTNVEEKTVTVKGDSKELQEEYEAALEEPEKLEQLNHSLQARLTFYFKERQFEIPEDFIRDFEPVNIDEEYYKMLSEIEEMVSKIENFKADSQKDFDELEKILNDKELETSLLNKDFYNLMRSVARRAVYSTTGEHIPPQKIETYLTRLMLEEDIKRQACVEYTKERNALLHVKAQRDDLKDKTCIMNMHEYELLVAETHFLNSRTEHRKKIVKGLLENCWNAVNVMTHLRQKLAFVRKDKLEVKARMKRLREDVKCMTEELSAMKAEHQASIKIERQKLKQKNFMLQNDFLLEDYENKLQQRKELSNELQNLKKQYAEASKFFKK